MVTVGASAGGYAAVLFGSLLQAEYALCFAGQFSIEYVLPRTGEHYYKYLFDFYRNANSCPYFNLTAILKNSQLPVYYFLPVGSEPDQEQFRTVSHLENIHTFYIQDSTHGVALYAPAVKKLIQASPEEIRKIFEKYKGRKLHKFLLSFMLANKWEFIVFALKKIIKRIQKR